MKEVAYEKHGIHYVEILHDSATEADYGAGIPLSYTPDMIAGMFPNLSDMLVLKLLSELQKRKLIRFTDYLRPTAQQSIKSALAAVYRLDISTLINFAKEVTDG